MKFDRCLVKDYMTAPVIWMGADATLPQAHERLLTSNISCLAIYDNNQLAGVLSRSDLLRIGQTTSNGASPSVDPRNTLLTLPDKPVGDYMSTGLITIGSNESIETAAAKMGTHQVHRLFVVDSNDTVGVLSTLDVMRCISLMRATMPIASIMNKPVVTVDLTTPVETAAKLLHEGQVSGLVVVESEWPVGVFTQIEALLSKDSPSSTPVSDVMDPGLICLPAQTSVQQAVRQALRMRVRRIVTSDKREMVGIVSGLDFARVAAGQTG